MTYLELCNAVRADANVQGTISTVVGQTKIYGNIVRWVNDAYMDIQAEHDNWRFLRIEDSIALPATFRDVDFTTKYVEKLIPGTLRLNHDDSRLQFQDYVSFQRLFPLGSTKIQTRQPTRWTELPAGREFIRLNSICDIEYTLYFEAIRIPYEMSANTDEPVWPAKYHDLIKNKALMKYAMYYNAQEVYQIAERAYNTKMPKFEYEYLPRNFFYTVPLV